MCDQNNDNKNTNGENAMQVVTIVAHTEELLVEEGAFQDGGMGSGVSTTTTNAVQNNSKSANEILLQCALTDVYSLDEKNSCCTCVLFDGCSQRTFITTELKNRLNPPCMYSHC